MQIPTSTCILHGRSYVNLEFPDNRLLATEDPHSFFKRFAETKAAGRLLDRDEYLFRGLMPGLYEEPLPPVRVYSNYYQTYVERDVRQFANIRDLIAFETFVKLLTGRVGQIVNISDLSGSVGVSATTLNRWLGILEASFIVFRLPPGHTGDRAGRRQPLPGRPLRKPRRGRGDEILL